MRMNERVKEYVKGLRVGDHVIYQDNQEFYQGIVQSVHDDILIITGTGSEFSRETSYAIGEPDAPPRIMYPTEEVTEKLRKHEEIRSHRENFAALFDRDYGYPDRFLRSAWSSLMKAKYDEFPTNYLERAMYLKDIRLLLSDDWHYDVPIRKIQQMNEEANKLRLR